MEPSEYCSIGLRKAGAFPCVLHCAWLWDAQPWSKCVSCERGVMKRNEGSNERSGVKDTRAAVRNEEELQVVWQTCVAARRALHVQQYLKSVINNFNCCWCNGLAYLLADDEWRTPIYRRSVGSVRREKKQGVVRWVFFHPIDSIKKRKPPTKEADMMK